MLQQKQSLTKQLQDQTSKVTQTVTDAHDIGYGDGLGKRVDALSQKYDGLETNINLRENRLYQKTQQYIAKLADLNQIGRYLQTYTKTINQQQVPVMRQLILAMQQGITIDTSNVTKSVYQEFQALTGHTIQEVIKTAVSDGFKKDRHIAQKASESAQLSADVAENAVTKLEQSIHKLKWLSYFLIVEAMLAILLVTVVPGGWAKFFVMCFVILLMYGLDRKLIREEK